jgi:GNAT superfamily N-acetyltransferase
MSIQVRLVTIEAKQTFASLLNDANAWQKARGSQGWIGPFDDDWMLPRIERGELYLAYLGDEAVAAFRLLDADHDFWGELETGDSIYLHTFAVRRSRAGSGISSMVIDEVARIGNERGRTRLRLDCFIANGIQWQTSGPLWRREALDRIGPWNENLQHVGHDHEFHVRALCRGLKIRKIPKVDYFWRVPRTDSLSSFESFKRRHSDGSMIKAYRSIITEVIRSGAYTPLRARLIAHEAIQLAVCCRSFGGSPAQAEKGLLDAHRFHLLGFWTTVVCRLLLRSWVAIAGKRPAMSLLSRMSFKVLNS